MNRTGRDTERKVFQLHFQGDTNYTVSLKLGIPTSTVSDIISVLPESTTHLQDLAKDLKKQNITIFEAKSSTQLKARLNDLGVSDDRLQSYIESSEKMQTNPDYAPKQIVQAQMKLNDLEQETGKAYSEVLLDFEEKKDAVKTLESTQNLLEENLDKLKIEGRRQLEENNIAKKEIDYVVKLRQNFHKYGARLNDPINLLKYLKNMRETGGDPRNFVKYTREQGSLIRRTDSLRRDERESEINLKRLKEHEDEARALSGNLDKQNNEKSDKLLAVTRRIKDAEQREAQILEKLGGLLNVEAKAEKVIVALAEKEARLHDLDGQIDEKQAQVQSLDQKAQELKNEIKVKLNIEDCATQVSAALASQRQIALSLEKQNREKVAELALVDTVKRFLTSQPYNFDLLWTYIEQIKKKREPNKYQIGLYPTDLAEYEEKVRMLALEAFKGLLATKSDYEILENEKKASNKAKEEAETKADTLSLRLGETEKKLESALKEKQLVDAIRVDFGGRTTNIEEIRNWVLKIFSAEIEQRAEEKHSATAAAVRGLLTYAEDRIASWAKNRAGSGKR